MKKDNEVPESCMGSDPSDMSPDSHVKTWEEENSEKHREITVVNVRGFADGLTLELKVADEEKSSPYASNLEDLETERDFALGFHPVREEVGPFLSSYPPQTFCFCFLMSFFWSRAQRLSFNSL